MKKARLIFILLLILTLACVLFVGCTREERITSISVKDYVADSVVETAVGAFRPEDYTLVLSYDSGRTEEITLNGNMINEADLFKLYQEGEHNIRIAYGACECVIKLAVKRSVLTGISFPENNVFTYDGKTHTVELVGDIPKGATVSYPGGNSFVNAGTYDISAVVSCDGYVTLRLSTTVKIERAVYDMSGVSFEPKEFVYDGRAHSVAIKGALPMGVSVPTYTINGNKTASAIDVGTYTVIASFATKDVNYAPVESMSTTLTIHPADYSITGADIVFKDHLGRVIDADERVFDNQAVFFDINDRRFLGANAVASFTVKDEKGQTVVDGNGNKASSIKDAGVYTVIASIALLDGRNYNAVEPITRTFEIKKASYDLSNVHFDSDMVIYSGRANSLSLIVPKDSPVGALGVTYEYYLQNTLVLDGEDPAQSVTNAGVYTVKAIFSGEDKNFEKIPDMQATLEILKMELDITSLGFVDSIFTYDGAAHTPSLVPIEGDLLSYGEVKIFENTPTGQLEVDSAKEVGEYTCTVTVDVTDSVNYSIFGESQGEISAEFEIQKKEIDLSGIHFSEQREFAYNGAVRTVDLLGFDESLLSVIYKVYGANDNEIISTTTVGEYTCVATVALRDERNYSLSNGLTTASFTCGFSVVPAVIDAKTLDFNTDAEKVFNGNAQSLTVTVSDGELSAVIGIGEPTYYRLVAGVQEGPCSPINAGDYRCVISVYLKDQVNYVLSSGEQTDEVSLDFKITPKRVDASTLALNGTLTDRIALGKEAVEYTLANGTDEWAKLTYVRDGAYVSEVRGVGKYEIRVSVKDESAENYILVNADTPCEFAVIHRVEIYFGYELEWCYPSSMPPYQSGESGYHIYDSEVFVRIKGTDITLADIGLQAVYLYEGYKGNTYEQFEHIQGPGNYYVSVSFKALDGYEELWSSDALNKIKINTIEFNISQKG